MRMGVGVALAILFFGTVGGLLFLGFLAGTEQAQEGRAAEVHVLVLRRDGSERFNGTLLVRPATALEALEAAGRAGAFEVRVVAYPNGRYVASIGGEAAEGAAGWVYAVTREGATAEYPPLASDRAPLAEGDRVVWHWTDRPIT